MQTGIFSRSRNPVFLGMIAITAGLFLAIPSAISLLAFGLCWASLELQVRLEEAHLRAALGQPYLDYCARVPRWLRVA
ncbi:MAG TPA: isoprenylcysteine carboxylmethyltransferase family protein [Anaerolineaceae bacterium]|nr:isoprenylcysteine carboxylmethyltransferase family protein [Anaerolineaceae bacterium]HPN53385.1 isoprenylcysteine carboxylmethyltransferase family protein [Anaerolineaceae bacterium]